MKLICEEFVEDLCGSVNYKYQLFKADENDKPIYTLRAEIFKDGEKEGSAQASFSDLNKAVKLYGLAIKTKITPLNLKYVIEDFE